jgi:hypothetical protein
MNVEDIQQLLSGLRLEIVWSLILAAIAFYIFVWIKDFLTTLMQYYQFKSNSYVSIGNMVSVNGFVGRIKKFGRTFIVVEGEAGYYRISMKNWHRHKWIFLRTEWKKDSEIAGRRLGLRHDDDIKIDRDLFNKVTSVIKYFEEKGELKVE